MYLFCRRHKKINPSFIVSKYQNTNAFPVLLGLKIAALALFVVYIFKLLFFISILKIFVLDFLLNLNFLQLIPNPFTSRATRFARKQFLFFFSWLCKVFLTRCTKSAEKCFRVNFLLAVLRTNRLISFWCQTIESFQFILRWTIGTFRRRSTIFWWYRTQKKWN